MYSLITRASEQKISNRAVTGQLTNTWKLNTVFLSDPEVKKKILKEMEKDTFNRMKIKLTHQYTWDAAKVVMKGHAYHITKGLYLKKIKISNQ